MSSIVYCIYTNSVVSKYTSKHVQGQEEATANTTSDRVHTYQAILRRDNIRTERIRGLPLFIAFTQTSTLVSNLVSEANLRLDRTELPRRFCFERCKALSGKILTCELLGSSNETRVQRAARSSIYQVTRRSHTSKA